MRVDVTIWAVAATMATATAAQPAPSVPAAPATAPRPEVVEDPRVSLWGYGSPRPEGVAKPLRSAIAANNIAGWLPATDPAIIAFLADSGASADVSLRLDIDPTGRVIACEARHRWRSEPLPAFVEGLCDRLSVRARFTPAIDETGTRVSDTHQLMVLFERVRRRPGAAPPPLIVERQPDPVPMLARESWPPYASGPVPTFAALLLAEGGAAGHASETAPWAGIELRERQGGELQARVVLSSGDTVFNGLAYGIARRSGPAWGAEVPVERRRVMIHFTSIDGAAQAILPVSERPFPAALNDSERTALLAAISWPRATDADKARLRFDLAVGADGRITMCRIKRSSGSDVGDVAACRAMRDLARFAPRRDIFGWPHHSSLFDWALVAQET